MCAFTLFLAFKHTITRLVVSETTAKIFFWGVGIKRIHNDQTQGYLSGLGWGEGIS